MIDAQRLHRYLSGHAGCAVNEARRSFYEHLTLFAIIATLFSAYGFVWMREVFLLWLVPLVAWGVGLWWHYHYGVRQLENELDACVTDLVDLYVSRTVELDAELSDLASEWVASSAV